ncbi:MAG: hypothetical protein RJA24_891, partial [Pseudomonadota bacterium]
MKKPLEVLRLYPEHDYTLNGTLASRAGTDPQRPFIFYRDRTWSWGEFAQSVDGAARVLAARGISKGDRVGVMARNCDGHMVMLFALARLGAIMVPVNPEFGVGEAKYVLHHAEVSAVAATQDTLDVARQAAAGLKTPAWFVMLDVSSDGVPLLDDLVRTAPQTALPGDIKAESTCLIVYTSGTTGFPKGAMHSQKS